MPRDTRSPLARLIDDAMKCVLCGEPMGCSCWIRCACGWYYLSAVGMARAPKHYQEDGDACGNPIHRARKR